MSTDQERFKQACIEEIPKGVSLREQHRLGLKIYSREVVSPQIDRMALEAITNGMASQETNFPGENVYKPKPRPKPKPKP